jgi:hypothetical protein
LFDVFGVSGCEHVKGRAIFNLLCQVRGGTETEDHLDASLTGKPRTDFREGIRQVRRRRDSQVRGLIPASF